MPSDPLREPQTAVDALAGRSLAPAVYDEIFRSLAHGDRPDDTFLLLAEKARLITDSGSCAIALLDSDRETLTFVAASGRESSELLGSRIHLSDTIVGKTARSGEPYLVYRPLPRSGDDREDDQAVHSAAVVAIFDEGRPIGALAALNKAASIPFSGDDLMTLATLAAAASITIRNARLQGDALRQSRELSLLYEAVRNVSGPLSSQEVLRTVAEQAAALLENSAVVVFLTNDERTHLYIADDIGFDGSPDLREVILSAESGLGAAVFATAQPLFLTFVGEEEQEEARRRGIKSAAGVLPLESPFPSVGARAGLAAAIRTGDATHGILLVLTGQPLGVYTPADANLLSALASQAAVAMENSWLYEDATRRAEEATTLYEISQAVTSTLRLPQVLDRVADAVLSLLGVDKFALFLHDPALDRLQMVVERGLPAGAADRIQPAVGQGIPGWVMEFETPTAVQDVAADHRNATAPLHTEGVVSMTGMPLQVGTATIGALCALSSRRRLFTVAEMELLYTIANQAAVAIENARMYADVRHKSLELRKSFHRVARALGSPAAPHAVPELIVSLAQELTGADCCALYSVQAPTEVASGASLRLEASIGLRLASSLPDRSGPMVIPADSPTAWVARKGRSLSIRDIDADERFRQSTPRPARGKLVSYLGVPLRTGNREILGVLEIYTRIPRHWQGEEVRLLLAFASQATVAVQNARLIEEGRRAKRRSDALAALLRLLTGAGPVVDSTSLTSAMQVCWGGGIVALKRDADGGDWRIDSSAGMSTTAAESLRDTVSAGRETSGLSVTSNDQSACLIWESPLIEKGMDSREATARADIESLLQMAVERLSRTA